MRVALVHDWLTGRRGGELVLAQLVRLFPGSEIFTLLHVPGSVGPDVESRPVHTSPLQRVPGIAHRYRTLLPLMPAALRFLDLRGFDLVISSSHCVAKGARVPPGIPHLAYVHSPMRYMWDQFDTYFGPGRASVPVRLAAAASRPALQAWDRRTAADPDALVANSHHVARRIAQFWGREADVIHPPVDLARFGMQPPAPGGRLRSGAGTPPVHAQPPVAGRGGYFLWLGALAPYKRVDLAVEAFRRTGHVLWIAGDGQDARLLRAGLPPNVRWLGKVPDADVPELYRGARALVFPGEEDFGIAPLEALASGRPVIALARGGALETVTPETGLLFDAPEPEALVEALRRFESFERGFEPGRARARAELFSEERFRSAVRRKVEALVTARPDLLDRLPW
ncbi:MAG TPA: glycosyltransferase [Myxococcaceae bacterium]|nr:glycosyltransferase [Myxococcaceae bacterium]